MLVAVVVIDREAAQGLFAHLAPEILARVGGVGTQGDDHTDLLVAQAGRVQLLDDKRPQAMDGCGPGDVVKDDHGFVLAPGEIAQARRSDGTRQDRTYLVIVDGRQVGSRHRAHL